MVKGRASSPQLKTTLCGSRRGIVADRQPDLTMLEREYFHLQSVIEGSDGKSLTIKAWSVSLTGLLAGSGAFVTGTRLLLFAAGVSLMFWLIDTSWKTFQYANYRRLGQIEEFMRGERANLDNLQISKSWSVSYGDGGLWRFVKIMWWPHVVLPHGAMCAALVATYFVLR
jgi:hypothetical protein